LNGAPEGTTNGVAPTHSIVPPDSLNPPRAVFPTDETGAPDIVQTAETPKPPLRLRVAIGPLSPRERSRILGEYSRINERRIPIQTFIRCTEQSPEGPAIHAVLETLEGSIAGHCCLVPFKMQVGRRRLTVAKAEYFFLAKEHRSRKVEGFENVDKTATAILLEQLYQCGSKQGWGPLLASPGREQSVHVQAGCQVIEFSMTECFFVLDPVRAWQWGAFLPPKQRRTLFLAGLAQRAFSSVVLPFTYDARLVTNPRIGERLPTNGSCDDGRLALAETEDFLRWRYPDDAYARFVLSDGTPGYAIVQKGSHGEYLRVHQSHAPAKGHTSALITELIRQADWSRALGVRWSVYGKGQEQERLISGLRRLGFTCMPRIRRVAVYSQNPEFLAADKWNLSDSLFTFEDLYPGVAFA